MKVKGKLLNRVQRLIDLSKEILDTAIFDGMEPDDMENPYSINNELFIQFRYSTLSFIKNLFGEKHPYYLALNNELIKADPFVVKEIKGILLSIKEEIENDWLDDIKNLASAEIFNDFLDSAEYLLSQNYKDAAAVMIGGVLEGHLRQLCLKNNIQIEVTRSNKQAPVKTNQLNAELTKNGIYNKLDHKSVLTWLDLRNSAAHGHYSEYTETQVESMLKGVLDFVVRNKIK